MHEPPTVSVVIPLWNKEAEVERTIRSVLAQTVQDFEIVVVNDGSTDRGPDIVAGIGDPRIRLIHQDNQGVSAARNRGIAEARSDLIAFLDADDEWRPCFLEEVLRLRAKYPAASVFATNYLYCDGKGRYSAPRIRGVPLHPWDGILEDYFAVACRSDPPLCSSAVAVTKAAITSVGCFPVGVNNGEDLLTWARLAVNCTIAYSNLHCAVFWRPQTVVDRPRSCCDHIDVVAQELLRLRSQVDKSQDASLQRYIALWHKMRASLFLQAGLCEEAIGEIRRFAQHHRMTLTVWLYYACAFVPPRTAARLMWWFRRVKRAVSETAIHQL